MTLVFFFLVLFRIGNLARVGEFSVGDSREGNFRPGILGNCP